MIDLNEYIAQLARTNRLAVDHAFAPCQCSGIGYLEGMLEGMRRERAFVCTTDVTDGEVYQRGGGWFRRRLLTVFILHRYRSDSPGDYEEKMNLCRELFRQFLTRHLLDEADLQRQSAFLNVGNVRFRELGGEFLNGLTGLYYMLSMDEPHPLCFNPEEWTHGEATPIP